jgi:hypothetical protein
MANIAPLCSARVPSFPRVSNLLTLSLPALSQIPFRGQGEGIGARYARLVKFTEKNAFGWALITRWPLNNRDRIKLFILKMIKCKNGLKHLIFASG